MSGRFCLDFDAGFNDRSDLSDRDTDFNVVHQEFEKDEEKTIREYFINGN